MSLTAAALRKMLEIGLTIEDALEIAEAIEAPTKSAGNALARGRVQQPRNDDRVWVYVMAHDDPEDDLVKIGISQHPNYRLETLQREEGIKLYLAHTSGPFHRSLAYAVEQRAHQALKDHRERGEWFRCDRVRAMAVVIAEAAACS